MRAALDLPAMRNHGCRPCIPLPARQGAGDAAGRSGSGGGAAGSDEEEDSEEDSEEEAGSSSDEDSSDDDGSVELVDEEGFSLSQLESAVAEAGGRGPKRRRT